MLAEPPVEWVCPMDPNVRSQVPSTCPRCGMKLVAGIPDPTEFPVHVDILPRAPRAGDNLTLSFSVNSSPSLQTIHEKLFHLFIVSGDRTFFAHEHPVQQPDGTFVWKGRLPLAGEYRLLFDFYPNGATPQMITRTLLLRKGPKSPLEAEQPSNLQATFRTIPAEPVAGQKTLLFFDLDPSEGLEKYLGAWGHMLAVSPDLADMIHTHPAFEDVGRTVQFNLIFPRPGTHKVWVQFQRNGVLNTKSFEVAVKGL